MAYFISSLALLATIVSFFYLRSYIKKQTALEQKRKMVQEIINEIDRVTDRDALLVEERVKRLNTLIADADRKIGVFDREIAARSRRDEVYAELGQKARFTAPPPAAPPEAAASAQNSSALTQAETPPPRNAAPPPAPAAAAALQPPLLPVETPETARLSKREQAILFTNEGLTPSQIAQRLETTVTEVEMLLVLHKK